MSSRQNQYTVLLIIKCSVGQLLLHQPNAADPLVQDTHMATYCTVAAGDPVRHQPTIKCSTGQPLLHQLNAVDLLVKDTHMAT